MNFKFKIEFLRGAEVIASVTGIKVVDGEHLTVAEMQQVIPTEQFLEKLLGLRVHIEQVD